MENDPVATARGSDTFSANPLVSSAVKYGFESPTVIHRMPRSSFPPIILLLCLQDLCRPIQDTDARAKPCVAQPNARCAGHRRVPDVSPSACYARMKIPIS